MIKHDGNTLSITINLDTQRGLTCDQSAQLTLAELPKLPFTKIEELVNKANAMVTFSLKDATLEQIQEFVMFHELVAKTARETFEKGKLKRHIETREQKIEQWNDTLLKEKKKKKEKEIINVLKKWDHPALKMCSAWLSVEVIPTGKEVKEISKFLDAIRVMYICGELDYAMLSKMYSLTQSKKWDMAIIRKCLKLAPTDGETETE